jgi:asparagine synthetase B (glutamine-hydrolysing)
MCGIYGITAKDEAFINKYIDVCSHRGPDGRGVWSDPGMITNLWATKYNMRT